VLLLQNRRPEAEAVLDGLLATNRADAPALGTLLQALVQDNKLPQAVAAVEAARLAEPSNPTLTAVLVDLHIKANEPKKALDVLHQALADGVPPPILLAAQARAQVADGDVADAKVTYRQILAGSPRDLETRRALVEVSLNSNDADSAKQALREGLKLSPGNLGMMNTLISMEQRSGGIVAALALADELRRDPANMPAASVIKGDAYMASPPLWRRGGGVLGRVENQPVHCSGLAHRWRVCVRRRAGTGCPAVAGLAGATSRRH